MTLTASRSLRLAARATAALTATALLGACASDPLSPPGPSAGEIVAGKVVEAVVTGLAGSDDRSDCISNGDSPSTCDAREQRSEFEDEYARQRAIDERVAARERSAELEADLAKRGQPEAPERDTSIMYDWSEPPPSSTVDLPAALKPPVETSPDANATEE